MKIGKRHVILAGLVAALGAAVYLNWQLSPVERFVMPVGSAAVSDSELGKARFVSADTGADADAKETGVANASGTMAESRLSRQNARDAALDELEKQLKDTSADSTLKAQALQSRTEHVANMQKENTAETLVKAKGFSDCLVFINGDKVTVLLPAADGLTSEKVSVVTEIVVAQTGVSVENITVTPVK